MAFFDLTGLLPFTFRLAGQPVSKIADASKRFVWKRPFAIVVVLRNDYALDCLEVQPVLCRELRNGAGDLSEQHEGIRRVCKGFGQNVCPEGRSIDGDQLRAAREDAVAKVEQVLGQRRIAHRRTGKRLVLNAFERRGQLKVRGGEDGLVLLIEIPPENCLLVCFLESFAG